MRQHHRQGRMEAVGSHGTPGRLAADLRGFTLIEILIALSTFLVVLFAVYTSFESSQATYAAGEQRADIQQSARIAMEMMSADRDSSGIAGTTIRILMDLLHLRRVPHWLPTRSTKTKATEEGSSPSPISKTFR